MPSAVTKAMIESYALMVLVMGTFFVYFCGMVWAFCNPKLSGSEQEDGAGAAEALGDECWVCDPNAAEDGARCPGKAHLPPPQYKAEWLTQSTYINFWDTDSLLSEDAGVSREDGGISNKSAVNI